MRGINTQTIILEDKSKFKTYVYKFLYKRKQAR